jgi:hypothetical protein
MQAGVNTVAWHAGQYFAFGHYGWVYTSSDGLNWTARYGSASNQVLRASAHLGDQLIAIGARGQVSRVDHTGTVNYGYVGQLVDLRGLASSGSRLVAVGMGGKIFRSDNGVTWTVVNSPVVTNLHAVAFNAGKFLAVGDAGLVLESNDGITWSQASIPTGENLLTVYGTNQGWFAAGGGGQLFHRPAGGTWRNEASGTAFDLHAIFETTAGIHACGNAGTLLIRSADGTWQPEKTGRSSGCDFRAAVVRDNRALLVGCSGFFEDHVSLSSSKGWAVAELSGGSIEVIRQPRIDFEAVVATDDGFVAGGWNGRICFSPDGVTWTEDSFPETSAIRDLAKSDHFLLAGGDFGIMWSTDAHSWTPVRYEAYGVGLSYTTPLRSVRRLAKGATDWLAVGFSGTVLRSSDGLTWHRPLDPGKTFSSHIFTGAAYGAGVWVISGLGGKIWTSADGENWDLISTPTTLDLMDVCYFGGKFIAAVSGADDIMLESVDGTHWTNITGVSGWRAPLLRSVDGRCYGLGSFERISSTGDGLTWRSHTHGTRHLNDSDTDRSTYRGVAVRNGVWVAVGSRGIISRSTDGDQWDAVLGGEIHAFTSAAYLRERLVALAEPGVVLTSNNGRDWRNHRSGNYPQETLNAVADNGSRAVAVGKTILISDDLEHWTEVGCPAGKHFSSVAWDGSSFIAGAKSGEVYRSSDGESWNATQLSSYPVTVAAIQGMGIALDGSDISVSLNGADWTAIPDSFGTLDLRHLYAGHGKFVATGTGYRGLFSADGLSWELFSQGKDIFGPAASDGDDLYALSPDPHAAINRLNRSSDGRNWETLPDALPGDGVTVLPTSGSLLTFHEYGEVMLGVLRTSPAFQTEIASMGLPIGADLSAGGDANGDGVSNLAAHFFGLSVGAANPPETTRVSPILLTGNNHEETTISIPLPENPPAYLRMAIETSDDLADWQEIAWVDASGLHTSAEVVSATQETSARVELTLPAEGSSGFFRLRFEEIP